VAFRLFHHLTDTTRSPLFTPVAADALMGVVREFFVEG
jgi:hypothetical protein